MRVTKVDVTIPSSGYYLGYVSLVLDNAYTLNGVRITRRADGGRTRRQAPPNLCF